MEKEVLSGMKTEKLKEGLEGGRCEEAPERGQNGKKMRELAENT